jgi:hypothetical protein
VTACVCTWLPSGSKGELLDVCPIFWIYVSTSRYVTPFFVRKRLVIPFSAIRWYSSDFGLSVLLAWYHFLRRSIYVCTGMLSFVSCLRSSHPSGWNKPLHGTQFTTQRFSLRIEPFPPVCLLASLGERGGSDSIHSYGSGITRILW